MILTPNSCARACSGFAWATTNQVGVYDTDFTMPAAGECGGMPSGSNHYYSFDYGNIHFVSLDSQNNLATNGPMYTWLQQATFLRDTGEIHDHFTIVKGSAVGNVRLSITHSGDTLTVSWPATATNYVLQISAAVGPDADWFSITDGITTTGNLNLFSLPLSPPDPPLFFRLGNATP